MQSNTVENKGIVEKLRERIAEKKARVLAFMSVSLLFLVSNASAAAFDINGTIGPIIDGVALLFTPLLNLVLAYLPVVIVIAIIGFVLGILSNIMGSMKMKF